MIVGGYDNHSLGYVNNLKKSVQENITFLNNVSEEELKELYTNCKGFITTAYDEDFGMTPVEAMACGKPVIASNEGGYKETIINKKTGILIDNINADKLINATEQIEKEIKINPNKYKEACQQRAKKFDTKVFIKKIKKVIKNYNLR